MEFEPWSDIPQESFDVVIPGRTDGVPDGIGSPSTRAEFEERRRQIRRELGRGGEGTPPPAGRQPEGLPQETPSPDVCAFYRSFRYRSGWGIHIGINCWHSIARFLHLNGVPAETAVDEAFNKLFQHELFHYTVDKATLALERVLAVSGSGMSNNWVRYHQANNPSLLEEALANGHAYNNAAKELRSTRSSAKDRKRGELVQRLLGEWMLRQPPGYRDFHEVIRPNQGMARAQLLTDIMAPNGKSPQFIPGLENLLRPESTKPFSIKFEGRPLDVYFF